MEKKPCIAIVPCPGHSHLNPLIGLAKRLVHLHPDLHVTFLIPTLGSPSPTMRAILESLPSTIDFTILPQVNIEDIPQNLSPVAQIRLTVAKSLPSLSEALSTLISCTNLVALIAHLFSVDASEIAKEFNLLTYAYISGATPLPFCLSLPKLDKIVPGEFRDLSEPLKIPGSLAFEARDVPEPVLERSSEAYRSFLHTMDRLHSFDGIILNTFTDLEERAINALQQKEVDSPPVFPVGPIVHTASSSQVNGSECLRWLDNQSPNSVLYVSFGSGGTLSHEQLNELAFGLELSGHKFVWAVRSPNKSASSAYLIAQNDDPLQFLPKGFLDRTKGQGLVLPSWAPQIEVLRHRSTGGFLTHCGWNSIMEGVLHGVPMIAWPLFAEQRMNAVLLTDELKVAVRPKVDETGTVVRKEVAMVVRSLMEGDEGKEMRKRMKQMKDAAAVAISEDGSSTRTLSGLALKWKNLSGLESNLEFNF